MKLNCSLGVGVLITNYTNLHKDWVRNLTMKDAKGTRLGCNLARGVFQGVEDADAYVVHG